MNRKLYSIAYGCPKEVDRCKDCPFNEIKNLSFREKVLWIDKLDDKRKEEILKHHLRCTKSKK